MPTTEEVRKKGQVWTPIWVSRAMASYVLIDEPTSIVEPSIGSGSLIDGLLEIASERKIRPHLLAYELHPDHLGNLVERVRGEGLTIDLMIGDYLQENGSIEAVISNPPYIRHQRFSEAEKTALQHIAETTIGCQIDRRTGIQIFFLLKTLVRMREGSRGAFILPADVFEGVSAKTVFRRLIQICHFEAVATFTQEATPFPGVDTNPIILFFKKEKHEGQIAWRQFSSTDTALENWVKDSFQENSMFRDREEAVEVGFSRAPRSKNQEEMVPLGAFIAGKIGITTGANDYFLKTRQQIQNEELPIEAFARCIGRTRDLDGESLTVGRLNEIEKKGRPTYVLYIEPGNTLLENPKIKEYLQQGETTIAKLPFVSMRNPWWKIERRNRSPILFSYLGRGDIKFIKNEANVLPLNAFLCIDPLHGNDTEALLKLLRDKRTTDALVYEAKSYGDGFMKMEPNAIERVKIPRSMLEEFKILVGNEQLGLF